MLATAIFLTIYNAEFGERWADSGGLVGAMTGESPGGPAKNIYKGTTEDEAAEGDELLSTVGRIDSIMMPFKVIDDPMRLLLGSGIGNVAIPSGERFDGEYTEEAELYGVDRTTISKLLWEIGLVGLGLSFLFFWFVFTDARALSVEDDISGAVALGWAAIIPILIATMFYLNIVDKSVLGYTMWYMSGYVVGKRYQHYYQTQVQNRLATSANRGHPTMRGTPLKPGSVRPF
jgi:hypothetical protein